MNFSADARNSKLNISKANNCNFAIPEKPVLQIELFLLPLQIYIAPLNQPYFPHACKPSSFEPLSLFVSLYDSMASVHAKVLQSLSHQHQCQISAGKLNPVRAAQGTPPLAQLLSHTRLWRLDLPDEASLDQMLQEVQIESRYSDVSDFAQVEVDEGTGHIVQGGKKVGDFAWWGDGMQALVLEVEVVKSQGVGLGETRKWIMCQKVDDDQSVGGGPAGGEGARRNAQLRSNRNHVRNSFLTCIDGQAGAGSSQEVQEEISRRLKLDLLTLFNPDSKRGQVGLKNLGNTCYMNSILQCMQSNEAVMRYFLLEIYQFQLNRKSLFGTKGKLAIAFGDLIADLYVGNKSVINPKDIKRIISQKATQFRGYSQHDSQEFLSCLLETLHEDLNEVQHKPYIQYDHNVSEFNDKQISELYWQHFISRERSLLIDSFYGQLKSKLQCTQCGHLSLTFDPFNILSLPVPNQKLIEVSFKYVPYHYGSSSRMIEFKMNALEYTTVYELKNKMEQHFAAQSKHKEKAADDSQAPFICVYSPEL